MIRLILPLMLIAGCTLPPIEVDSYIPAISVCCGVAATTSETVPSPKPSPDPSEDCDTCGGEGWLGDGQPRSDCPDCNTKWDNHFRGVTKMVDKPEVKEPLTAETELKKTASDYKTPAINWHYNLTKAKAAAKRTDREILVHFWFEGCGPCVAIQRNVLQKPEVVEYVNANYIPIKIDVKAEFGGGLTNGQAWRKTLRMGNHEIPCPSEVVLKPDGTLRAMKLTPCATATPAEYIQHLKELP